MAEMTAAARSAPPRSGSRRSTASSAPADCSCRSGSKASPSPTPSGSTRRTIDRRRARRAAARAPCSIRCCGSASSTPIRTRATSSSFADGTLGLIDFGAVGRLDPIQQAAVVDMLAALIRRDVSLLRDGIERVADVSEAVSPSGSSGRSPG